MNWINQSAYKLIFHILTLLVHLKRCSLWGSFNKEVNKTLCMKRKCNIVDILDYDKMKIYENENFSSNENFKVAIGPKYAK